MLRKKSISLFKDSKEAWELLREQFASFIIFSIDDYGLYLQGVTRGTEGSALIPILSSAKILGKRIDRLTAERAQEIFAFMPNRAMPYSHHCAHIEAKIYISIDYLPHNQAWSFFCTICNYSWVRVGTFVDKEGIWAEGLFLRIRFTNQNQFFTLWLSLRRIEKISTEFCTIVDFQKAFSTVLWGNLMSRLTSSTSR